MPSGSPAARSLRMHEMGFLKEPVLDYIFRFLTLPETSLSEVDLALYYYANGVTSPPILPLRSGKTTFGTKQKSRGQKSFQTR
jgi:hypothetical protein